jgi:hypothetical protein
MVWRAKRRRPVCRCSRDGDPPVPEQPQSLTHDLQYMWGPAPGGANAMTAVHRSTPGSRRHLVLLWTTRDRGRRRFRLRTRPRLASFPSSSERAIVPRYPFAKSVKEMDKTSPSSRSTQGRTALRPARTTARLRIGGSLRGTRTVIRKPGRAFSSTNRGALRTPVHRSRAHTVRFRRLPGRDWHARQWWSQPALFAAKKRPPAGGRGPERRKDAAFGRDGTVPVICGGIAAAIEPSGAAFGMIAP